MSCPQCQGIEEMFDQKTVSRDLADYRTKGADKTTRMLIEALKKEGVDGLNLLDIGGGVGAIQHALIEAGVKQVTDVDASQAYARAAREEADRRGLAERIQVLHGNFVELAPQLPPADIVTLDRVVCCYDDMEQLVELSAERANKLYGLVYPRDTWPIRLAAKVGDALLKLMKKRFRFHVHSSKEVEAILHRHNLQRRSTGGTLFWQVVVYGQG